LIFLARFRQIYDFCLRSQHVSENSVFRNSLYYKELHST